MKGYDQISVEPVGMNGSNFKNETLLVLTFYPFNYKVKDVISRNLQILKNDHEKSAILTINLLSP